MTSLALAKQLWTRQMRQGTERDVIRYINTPNLSALFWMKIWQRINIKQKFFLINVLSVQQHKRKQRVKEIASAILKPHHFINFFLRIIFSLYQDVRPSVMLITLPSTLYWNPVVYLYGFKWSPPIRLSRQPIYSGLTKFSTNNYFCIIVRYLWACWINTDVVAKDSRCYYVMQWNPLRHGGCTSTKWRRTVQDKCNILRTFWEKLMHSTRKLQGW